MQQRQAGRIEGRTWRWGRVGVVLEEVGSEGRTVDFVGAVQDNIVADVGVCATCCLREDRRHVPLEFLQRRLLATSEELLVARNRRGSMQMRVRHCRLQQVEARGQPVCGIFTPQTEVLVD